MLVKKLQLARLAFLHIQSLLFQQRSLACKLQLLIAVPALAMVRLTAEDDLGAGGQILFSCHSQRAVTHDIGTVRDRIDALSTWYNFCVI